MGKAVLWALCVIVSASSVVLAADRYALLIGVDRCEAVGKLNVCCADARAMKAVLEQVGYPSGQVTLLTDDVQDIRRLPTGGNIRNSIARIAGVAVPGDTILVFFSGHGVTRENEGYIVPVDGDLDGGIALSDIKTSLASSKATNRFLILDACHAGAAKGVTGIAPDLKSPGVTMLLSCEKEQVSWADEATGHSVFTQYLVEGLSGKAGRSDQKIAQRDLHEYVLDRVKKWTYANDKKLQTPVLVASNGADAILAERSGTAISLPTITIARASTTTTEAATTTTLPQPARPEPTKPLRVPDGFHAAPGTATESYSNTGWAQEIVHEMTGIQMVFIPAGEFMIGSSDREEARYGDEGPAHRVQIVQPFYMGIHEVSQAQYEAVMDINPANFRDPSYPVETVSWKDAMGFCQKLSEYTGQTVRLPTEAEWEYSCRAGTTMAFSFGGMISTEQANYDGNYTYSKGGKGVYRSKPMAVGSYQPNGFGLYDMHGNVWEWCRDIYDRTYYGSSPYSDPQGPDKGPGRVLRGGSWDSPPRALRAACRYWAPPDNRASTFGFRVVQEISR